MTEPRSDGVVHQAFFGWSHEAGRLTLLSHSFPRMEEATRWLRRLEAHLRLAPVPGMDLPPQALSYFDYEDGSAAVLHRVNAGYSTGRNNSHALIGSSATIGVVDALGLWSWPGWQARPPLEPIPAAYFLPAKVGAEQQLRPLAERYERELVVVLTRLLDDPSAPLSIIGCPDEARLGMVWGLRQATDDYLRQRGMHRSWSFSTYEDRHDVDIEGLPEIVFLPARPESAAVVHRTIVELDRYPPPPSPNTTLASELVARLLRGTPLRASRPIGGIRMTVDDRQSAQRRVHCPICADDFDWPNDFKVSIYDEENNRYEEKDISTLNPAKQANLKRLAYRRCPNPSRDTAPHYLPATYANYQDPLVIGMVGAPNSGKTHLLTAMIRQAYRGGLRPHRVNTAALDFRRHAEFHSRFIEPFEKGGALPGTRTGIAEAADILLLRGPGGERPVTFFDVAGEDLESTAALNRATRFLVGANAVIFVHASEDPLETRRPAAASENRSFELAVERLQDLPGGVDRLPVVIAVTKSDRLRYVPPADRWLRLGDDRAVDAAQIRAESRDVYTYLHHVEAGASLRPFETFTRCTLHFVSASGGDAVPADLGDENSDRYFPRGVRPTRVLEPLVSILAMTGMITGPEAEKVGIP